MELLQTFLVHHTKNGMDLGSLILDCFPFPPPETFLKEEKLPSRSNPNSNFRTSSPPRKQSTPKFMPPGPNSRPDYGDPPRLRTGGRRILTRRRRTLPQNPRPRICQQTTKRGSLLHRIRTDRSSFRTLRPVLARDEKAHHPESAE